VTSVYEIGVLEEIIGCMPTNLLSVILWRKCFFMIFNTQLAFRYLTGGILLKYRDTYRVCSKTIMLCPVHSIAI